jgi:hypothetical protein
VEYLAGKKWTPQQQTQLQALVQADADLEDIAAQLQKSPGAVIVKCQRLRLPLKTKGYAATPLPIPKELPSVEEALRMLAGALKAAAKPGIDRVEVQRLQAVAAIAKTYKELLSDYINYREIEIKLKEMEQENARLQKESQNPTPQPNPPPVA